MYFFLLKNLLKMDINDSESIDDSSSSSISSSGGSSNVSDLISYTDSDDSSASKNTNLGARGNIKRKKRKMSKMKALKILSTQIILPKSRVFRAIRAITQEIARNNNKTETNKTEPNKFKKDALEALRYALEDYLYDYLAKSLEVTLMSKRKTTMDRDFSLVRTISQKDYLPKDFLGFKQDGYINRNY